MASRGGAAGSICGAIAIGVLVGYVVRHQIPVMLGLLGLVGGFFSGTFTFAFIVGATGGRLNAEWVYWFFAIVSAIAGLIAGYYKGTVIIQFTTALVGSYLFMRAWTLFFPGNWPSEAELVEHKDEASLEMSGLFWVYVSIFFASFAFSLWYQCYWIKDEKNKEVKMYEDSLLPDPPSHITDGSVNTMMENSNKSVESKKHEEEDPEKIETKIDDDDY